MAIPVAGATRLGQLDDAVSAVDLDLSREDIDSLEAPYVPHAVKGLAQRLEVLGPPRVRDSQPALGDGAMKMPVVGSRGLVTEYRRPKGRRGSRRRLCIPSYM